MNYGLIGEKLGHSFSKEIHSKIGDYDYRLKEIPPEKIKDFFSQKNFKGVNVTIPYKETIIPYLDFVSEGAKKIGAVNTVVNKNGRLYGYNTDYFGARDLILKSDIQIKDKKVLVLGTGGTSKTLSAVAWDLGAKCVLKVSRKASDGAITYSEAYSEHTDADIIINTTPVGMYPNTESTPIDVSEFPDLSGVIDVIYNPLRTKLVTEALSRNVKATGGLFMLAGQAVYASALFFGEEVNAEKTDEVYNAILKQKQNVVLTGMPSCGKSTVAQALSQALSMPYYDSDDLIVKKNRRQITEIFAACGEQAFRNIESEVIKELSKLSGVIIATGGGAVLNAENVKALKQNGKLFFIDRPLDKLIATESRPLSSDKQALQKRFEERYPVYKACCDYEIDADCPVEEVVDKITRKL
ncbi:MAG: shikimate kinase [Christensenellaceae bacterium]